MKRGARPGWLLALVPAAVCLACAAPAFLAAASAAFVAGAILLSGHAWATAASMLLVASLAAGLGTAWRRRAGNRRSGQQRTQP